MYQTDSPVHRAIMHISCMYRETDSSIASLCYVRMTVMLRNRLGAYYLVHCHQVVIHPGYDGPVSSKLALDLPAMPKHRRFFYAQFLACRADFAQY